MSYKLTSRTVSLEYTDSLGVTREFKFHADHRSATYICDEFILQHGVNGRTVGIHLIGGWTGEFTSTELLTHEFSKFIDEKWEEYT